MLQNGCHLNRAGGRGGEDRGGQGRTGEDRGGRGGEGGRAGEGRGGEDIVLYTININEL